ncbi:MAG: HIT family protein [Planctomycetia bacterium]|nr:HIT family protein [Planctomycetia bacterium]
MTTACPLCEKTADPNQLSELVWEFPLSVAVLGEWQQYRGYCVLLLRKHGAELSELSEQDRRQFLDDMSLTAQAIERAFRPRKMNYEMLGNQVPHMHWHLIPRYPDDPDARQPIWGPVERAGADAVLADRLRGEPSLRRETIERVRRQLQELTSQRA